MNYSLPETNLNIDGTLWTFISLKTPPDGTYPGILRELMTIGFPVVVSTQVSGIRIRSMCTLQLAIEDRTHIVSSRPTSSPSFQRNTPNCLLG